MKKENGITIVALTIIVIAVGIIIFSAVQYVRNYMYNQKIEDKKAEMLAVQTVVTNIKNKNTVDAKSNILIGVKVEIDNNQTGYVITEEFKNELAKIESADMYILTNEDLKNSGINNINVNENEFYIVDYNSKEIFYSLGINGKYKLSEI